MELPASDKVGGFGKRPHIKKGYYPGKLISVEERKDQEDKPYEGKFGRQLIMEFAVYQADEEGKPTKPITITINEEGKPKTTEDVTLPKFVYHQYKNRKTGELQTAVTANGAITKVFQALGWTFDGKGKINTNEFIGKWVELNIDDYEDYEDKVNKTEPYKASTIKDINKYEGPPVTIPNAAPCINLTVPKSLPGREDIAQEGLVEDKPTESTAKKVETADAIDKIKAKLETLHEMKEEGTLTKDGYTQAAEQLNKQLSALGK